ncbi:MAG TPA: hypothetical protein EYQ50_00190 [Verrucomicrobiales bacterium]|nr:hypothetical protein [Verrucomicrobiales bacterium]
MKYLQFKITPFFFSLYLTVLSGSFSDLHGQPANPADDLLQRGGFSGGVILHLGSGDGSLTCELYRTENSLVYGLEVQAQKVLKARAYAYSKGVSGKVSFDHWDRGVLPFSQNFINLIICEDPSLIDETELLRVLAPRGIALIRNGSQWTRLVKEIPSTIDDWPQHFYAANGNAVSKDKQVKPPLYHLQWTGGPRWSRHHDVMSSFTACVSAGGRLFYIFDEGTTFSPFLPTKWKLIARDAFNGTVLWKRSIPKWFPNLHKLKSGPSNLPRRLVATDTTVYVTLGIEAKVSALDAATGELLHEYQGTEGAEELVIEASTDSLFLVADQNDKPELKKFPYSALKTVPVRQKRIMKVDLSNNQLVWTHEAAWSAPLSMCADVRHTYFFNGKSIVALSKEDGSVQWESLELPVLKEMPTNFGPTVVAHDNRVLFTGGENYRPHNGSRGKLSGLDALTGELLWQSKSPASGYQSPEDLRVVGGLIWQGDVTAHEWNGSTGVFSGVDPKTGVEALSFNPSEAAFWFHHRCFPAKATEDYILLSRTGIEFIDVKKKEWTLHHWVRGACLYGIMPANGLVYAPPHPCACYIGSKLFGFSSLAAKNANHPVWRRSPDEHRLILGSAQPAAFEDSENAAEEWPIYRHNNRRSGATQQNIGSISKEQWNVKLGGKLTPPVIADKTVVVVQKEQHTVSAINIENGELSWRFTAGSRIDSSPTLYRHRVYFGCSDGYIYCLDLSDGNLIWKYQGAPTMARHMYFEQIESTHPLHGSVLIQNDKVYAVAGRSMFVDGGMSFLILDAKSGRKLKEIIMDDRVPGTDEPLQLQHEILNMPQALSDLLSCDGDQIHMRLQDFDLEGERLELKYDSKLYGETRDELQIMHSRTEDQVGPGAHIISGTGYLDDSWWHRTYWTYGKNYTSGWSGYYQAGKKAPSGRILNYDEGGVFGFGRMTQYYKWSKIYQYYLYNRDYENKENWGIRVPILIRSMLLSDDNLYILGPEELLNQATDSQNLHLVDTKKLALEQDEAFAGNRGALLMEVDRENGTLKTGFKLHTTPVFDGMAIAYNNLFISMSDGSLICLGSSGKDLQAIPNQTMESYKSESRKPLPIAKGKGKGKGKGKNKGVKIL